MLLALIGGCLAFVYARRHGRNPVLWALLAVVLYIGVQTFVWLLLDFGAGLAQILMGFDESVYAVIEIPIYLVSIGVSIFALWRLLKFLDSPIENNSGHSSPPQPPVFDGSDV